MAFPSKELGRLLGCSAINRFFSVIFSSGRLPCAANLMGLALFTSWKPFWI